MSRILVRANNVYSKTELAFKDGLPLKLIEGKYYVPADVAIHWMEKTLKLLEPQTPEAVEVDNKLKTLAKLIPEISRTCPQELAFIDFVKSWEEEDISDACSDKRAFIDFVKGLEEEEEDISEELFRELLKLIESDYALGKYGDDDDDYDDYDDYDAAY